MATLPLIYDLKAATKVTADTLEPVQQKTRRALQIQSSFRQQFMCKHPFLSDFHCKAEHLYAGLLEGDKKVISYVPQPFLLRIGRRRYTPDVYVLRKGSLPRVIELKPDGKMDQYQQEIVTAFFARERVVFSVVSNEVVFAREIEAANWLEVVRQLHIGRLLDTATYESTLAERLKRDGTCCVGNIVDSGNRESSYLHELALLRLLHAGVLSADLSQGRLGWDTEIQLCV